MLTTNESNANSPNGTDAKLSIKNFVKGIRFLFSSSPFRAKKVGKEILIANSGIELFRKPKNRMF